MGRNHALRLAQAGAAVAIFDLGDKLAGMDPGYPLAGRTELDSIVDEITENGGRAVGFAGDVRLEADLEDAVNNTIETFGQIDILVANAGIAMTDLVWEMSRTDWDKVIEVNLTGAWQTCKAVVPRMIEQSYGRIILISSIMGLMVADENAAYCAAKHGINALGQTLAREVGKYGITVNMLCPGTVPTGLNLGQYRHKGWDAERMMQESGPDTQAIPKMLSPDDVTNMVLFLASDQASLVTGTVIPIDAGATLIGW
jgi:NAD(P)-dependent dehydrogenase (short-subunit alcohol dehydrogenase family)